jgi:hypothetical protein
LKSSRLQEVSCLVLDVRLPGMSGLQRQRHLAQPGYRIPIILSLLASMRDSAHAPSMLAPWTFCPSHSLSKLYLCGAEEVDCKVQRSHKSIGELGMAGERETTGKTLSSFPYSFPGLSSRCSFCRAMAFQQELSRKGNAERHGTRTCCARLREIGGRLGKEGASARRNSPRIWL